MEHKAVGVSGLKELGDEDSGLIRAIVSVTGIKDNVRDIILPGAYEKSLKTRTPKGVWHHNWHESISRTQSIKEMLPGDPDLPSHLPDGSEWPREAGALEVVTQFNLKTTRGKDAYEDVKFFGDDQEWSIGYNVPVGGATTDSKSGIRSIATLDLYEYSPVLFGAMPVARTASVKDAQTGYAEIKSLKGDEAGNFLMEMKSLLGDEAFEGIEEKGKDCDDDDKKKKKGREIDDSSDQGLPEEFEDEDEDDEDEDEKETKSADSSAAQAELIMNAIKALQALIPGASIEATAEEKAFYVEDFYEVKELADMVEDAGFDQFSEKAADFDVAAEEGDLELMEKAAGPILDFIEAMIDFEDADEVKEMAAYIAEEFKKAAPEEEEGEEEEEDPDAEEPEEEEVEDEEKSAGGNIEVKSISLAEIEAALS